MANILITGGSGYLGGDLLAHLKAEKPLPAHGTVYALVRSDEQAKKVEEIYGATPLRLDLDNQQAITECLLEKKISIVLWLINAVSPDPQVLIINALQAVGKQEGVTTHFVHTSGAKVMSSFTDMPLDRAISDAGSDLYDLQKKHFPHPDWTGSEMFANAAITCTSVLDAAEAKGVRGYIFFPCIAYGESRGFGNPLTAQTVALVQGSKAVRQVYKPDNLNGSWPVCSVYDNSTLYVALLSNMLKGKDIGHGKEGYYLASSGSVAYADMYPAFAKALAKRGVVDNAEVKMADDAALEKMAEVLGGGKGMVSIHYGGICPLKADRGKQIGWKPKHSVEHILETAGEQVDQILKHSKA